MLDFCHLCMEISFKTIYGNFPSKSSAGEPSEAQQPKTKFAQLHGREGRKGEERLPLNFIFEKLGFKVTRFLLV